VAYSAEIDVKVRNLGSINQLEQKLSSISKSVNAINKKRLGGGASGGGGGGGSSANPDKEELAVLKLRNTALTQVNRGLRAQNKLKGDGLKLEQAIKDLEGIGAKSNFDDLDAVRKEIEENKKILIQTEERLIDEKRITTEIEKRAKLLKGGPTGFKADQFGPQMAPTKGAGQAAMSIDTITKQSDKRLRIELKLRELEAKGVNTAKLRGKMGELVDAQNRKEFGDIKRINREIGRGIAKEESKLKLLQLQNRERAKEDKLIRDTAPSSALNFGRRGELLRGPAGSGKLDPRNLLRRFDKQSALISGGFPLLFGQGPITAAAGALGGGIGGAFGQMGGFAGGIAATALVQSVSNTVNEVGKLGQALNPLTSDISALTQATGLLGTQESLRLQIIEETQGKQAALAAVTKEMALVIGSDGVASLKKFGNNFTAIQNRFARFSLKLRSGFADLFNTIIENVPGLKPKGGSTPSVDNAVENRLKENSSVIKANTEIDRLNKEILDIKAQIAKQETQTIQGALIPKELTDFFKGGSTLFPSQMKSSDELIAEQDLPGDLKDLKGDLKVQNEIVEAVRKRIRAEEEVKLRKKTALDLQTSLLSKTTDEIELLKAKLAGTSEELLINREVDRIKQAMLDKGILEKDINEDLIRQQLENEKSLTRQVETAERLKEAFESISQSIGNDIQEGIKGLIKGTSTLSDLLNNVADKFLDVALNQGLFGDILGSSGPKGGGILGFLTGGKLAEGGRAAGGKSFLVGEKGPELFVPSRSGNVIPNDKLGGGGNTSVTVNVDASGSSVEGDESDSEQLGRLIGAAVQAELIKESRPGGLLALQR